MIKLKKAAAFTVVAGLCAAAMAACGNTKSSSSSGSAGATYNWQVGNVLAEDQPWDMGLNKFADLLDQYSDGRMKLTVQSGGSLGSEVDMLQSVQNGTLDMSILSTPSMSGLNDTQNCFDLPYLFKSTDSAWQVMNEWLAKDRCDALQGTGFKGLGYFDNGEYMIASNKKIVHPNDVNGLRIRAHSSKMQSDTLAAVGANPLNVAWGDIYTSLQQKTIDGVSGTTLTNMYGGKFYEQTKYIAMTKQHFIPALVVINEDIWNSMPESDQKIVQKAFDEATVYERKEAIKYADTAKNVIEKAGVKINDIDADEWAKATESVYKEYVGDKGISKELVEKIQKSEEEILKK